MNRKLSQENLKMIACATMLIDHFAAVLLLEIFPMSNFLFDAYSFLRIVGRLAFPIYCFLLAEGAIHTRNPKKYALRMAIGALLSELPYDYAFHGGWTLAHQSVMITLLLGYGALVAMEKCPEFWQKILICLPFALLAQYLHTDYGAKGVLLVALFDLTRELPHKCLLQFFGMWCLFSPNHRMMLEWIPRIQQTGRLYLTTQEWAVLALLPIHSYSGEKRTTSKAIQWAFYLFYPVHLTVLHLWSLLL